RARIVAARIDRGRAVAVDVPVLRVERGRVRLGGEEGRLLGRGAAQLLPAAEGRELGDRRVELLLRGLSGAGPLLAGFVVGGRTGEGGVGLLLVALDDRPDRLAEGLAETVAALQVTLRVGHAAGVVAAEGQGRGGRGARRARAGGGRRGTRAEGTHHVRVVRRAGTVEREVVAEHEVVGPPQAEGRVTRRRFGPPLGAFAGRSAMRTADPPPSPLHLKTVSREWATSV